MADGERAESGRVEGGGRGVGGEEGAAGRGGGAEVSDRHSGPSLEERFVASTVLSAAGDAIGYNNGRWEFCDSGTEIARQLEAKGGWARLDVAKEGMRVSDDTVMHLATLEALVECDVRWSEGKEAAEDDDAIETLGAAMGRHYVTCWGDMAGRAPGGTCGRGVEEMKCGKAWDEAAGFYRGADTGCGAAMRAMGIGLVYAREEELERLIATAAESSRITHNHVAGVLSAVVAAAFTAYALRGRPVDEWPRAVVDELAPRTMRYLALRRSPAPPPEPHASAQLATFLAPWRAWLDGEVTARLPADRIVLPRSRDALFHKYGAGWNATSSVWIAFEAFRHAGDRWDQLCTLAAVHGGDNDSTAAIAAAWFGARYGFHSARSFPGTWQGVEYRARCEAVAKKLCHMSTVATETTA